MSEPITHPPSRRNLILGLGCLGLVLLFVALGVAGAIALLLARQAAAPQPAAAYILDTSPRMLLAAQGEANQTRLEVAQAVLAEAIRPADPSVVAGLRVFGRGEIADSCKDTDLVVPFAEANQSQIADSVFTLTTGSAPDAALGEAMLAAIRDLATFNGPHFLVVITGGVDSCNAEAASLLSQEAERAGVDLQSFVVGYQLTFGEAQAVRGWIGDAPHARFYSAPDASTLVSVMGAVQAYIDSPTDAGLEAIELAAVPPPTPTPSHVPPTATSVPTPTPAGYAAQSACDHPYFPLRPGATWSYQAPDLTSTSAVSSVEGDLESASATITAGRVGGRTSTTTYACSPEGLFVQQAVSVDPDTGASSTLTYSFLSGTTFPSADQMVPGSTWSAVFTLTSTDSSGAANILTIRSTYTAVAEEQITVAAGTFTALRVDVSSTSTAADGAQSESSLTAWYAYGVGNVRTLRVDGSVAELVSYQIPD